VKRCNINLDETSLKYLQKRRKERGEGHSRTIRLALSVLKKRENKAGE